MNDRYNLAQMQQQPPKQQPQIPKQQPQVQSLASSSTSSKQSMSKKVKTPRSLSQSSKKERQLTTRIDEDESNNRLLDDHDNAESDHDG